ncbi:MAG TPA: NAD(P)-binding domain-containing protein [Propionicimonas sp.]|jgi:hypothetical protein|uniref:NADPH-dependent F420 reductase n=1 Tax=Propionicimonas sp. TaxID=1955623 RepID=UPI002F418579
MAAERDEVPGIGILGAGRFGLAIARLALRARYRVWIASSGSTGRTTATVAAGAPGAVATGAAELPAGAELVILAVPLRRFRELSLPLLAGRVVIDAMNYWRPVDGLLPGFDHAANPTSLVVRDALPPGARLVKTLNHLSYHQVEGLARPAGDPDRSAIAVSGDDPGASGLAMSVVDRLGFDPVRAGDLRASVALQPGSPIFGRKLDAASLQHLLATTDGVGRVA